MLIKELENYKPIPSDELEAKLDFFYSPYNKSLHYGKHMDFENPEGDVKYRTMSRKDSPDWRKLMNFITSTDKQIFRKSLTNINNALYLELGNIAIKEEMKRRSKREKDCSVISNSSSKNSLKIVTKSPHEEIKQYNPSSMLLNKRRNFARKSTQRMSLYETNKILLNFKTDKMKNLIGIYWKKKEDETVKKKDSINDTDFSNQINKFKDNIEFNKSSINNQKRLCSNSSTAEDMMSYAYIKQKMNKINKFKPIVLNKQRIFDIPRIEQNFSLIQNNLKNLNRSIDILDNQRKCENKTKKVHIKCRTISKEEKERSMKEKEARKETISQLVKLFRVPRRRVKSKLSRNNHSKLAMKSEKHQRNKRTSFKLSTIKLNIDPLQKSMNEMQVIPIADYEYKCNKSCRDMKNNDEIENKKQEVKRMFLEVNNSMFADERTHASSIVNLMSVDERDTLNIPKSQFSTYAYF